MILRGKAKGNGRNNIRNRYLISTLDINPNRMIVQTESNIVMIASILVNLNLDKQFGPFTLHIINLLIF